MWMMKFEKETWKIFQPIVFCYGGCSVSLWFSPTGPFVMRSDLSSNTAAMFLLTIFWSQSKLVFTYFLMVHKGGLTSEIFFILAWVSCEGIILAKWQLDCSYIYFLNHRNVASSRPVYYSILELFWPKVTVHKHHISPS